jgi:dTMP kinase
MSGALVTVEGVEGAGKSTQAARLADALRRDGREVVLTREPGGTELGRALRRMLLDESSPGPTPETELLLYLADRAEHVRRVVRPAIERGAIVIADRFSDSTIAYQSSGRGLARDIVGSIDEFARGGVVPALTFVLDLPPEEGSRERARSRRPTVSSANRSSSIAAFAADSTRSRAPRPIG